MPQATWDGGNIRKHTKNLKGIKLWTLEMKKMDRKVMDRESTL